MSGTEMKDNFEPVIPTDCERCKFADSIRWCEPCMSCIRNPTSRKDLEEWAEYCYDMRCAGY